MESYITYRIAAWQFVNWIIRQAEQSNQLLLDPSTRKIAKGIVINWLIEVTELAVDLDPIAIDQQESHRALCRLDHFSKLYQTHQNGRT